MRTLYCLFSTASSALLILYCVLCTAYSVRNRNKPSVFAPRPRRSPQRVARGPQKSQQKTSVFARRSPQRVVFPQSRLRPTAWPKRKKLLLLSKRGRARGDMQERIRRRRYAGEDMQELSLAYPLLHVLSCVSSPAYPLLHILSCMSSPAYHPLAHILSRTSCFRYPLV